MTGHIFIYGGIGTERGEISFDNVNQQLSLPENKAADTIITHIISPGGDVFEGEAIYNALKNSGKTIETHIEGTCASIATLIAGAGSKIVMNKTARFMIHNPKISGMTKAADSRDLRHVADQLDQIKTLLINVYDQKTSLGKEKLWELYDNETWLTADEAEKMGFIDESVDAIKAVAKIDLNKRIEMENSKTFIDRLKNLFTLNKFRNEFTETLADGRVIIVMSEDENWTGKQVILEDGSALPDGTHELASGKSIVVAGGLITEVKEGEPAAAQPNEDMQNKIKELEAQLAEAKTAQANAEAQLQASQAKATAAEAKATKFENRTTAIEKEFLALKELANQTVGDRSNPIVSTFQNVGDNQQASDPMGDAALDFYKSRHIITNQK